MDRSTTRSYDEIPVSSKALVPMRSAQSLQEILGWHSGRELEHAPPRRATLRFDSALCTPLAWCIVSTLALLLFVLEEPSSERWQRLSWFFTMLLLLQGASGFAPAAKPAWVPGAATHGRFDNSGLITSPEASVTIRHSSPSPPPPHPTRAPPPPSSRELVPYYHGRGLTSVTVSTFAELETALAGSADTIRLAAGTYAVTSTLSVERNVVLTADVEGSSVVLDGGHTGYGTGTRVMLINSGTVELIGLTITKGYAVRRGRAPVSMPSFTLCALQGRPS